MADGRLDRMMQLYSRRERVTPDDWRDLQRTLHTLDTLLSLRPEARKAMHAVITAHHLRPDDPPRLEHPGTFR